MSNVTPGAIPAGWYADPAGSTKMRWWDGTQWTESFQEPYSTAASIAALKAPEGTKPYTVWIWLIVFLPLLSLLSYLLIDWSQLLVVDLDNPGATTQAQFAMMSSPGYVLSQVGGYLIYGLIVLFAFFDYRALQAAGVPKPFHWAFAFLSIVYPIGRSVVVHRRTGHGLAPMWITIGIVVVGFIIGIVTAAVIMSSLFSTIQDQIPRG